MVRTNPHRARRGLAPLEFVLWLPVLLSVTALMVVFGVMGAWRVRGEIVSRDAVWRTRWPRTGANEPRPDVRTWPADAEMRTVSAPAFTLLDIPAIHYPVVRGPLDNGFVVNNTLNPTRGAREGRSAIVQQYPLLPDLGPYRSGQIRHPLLDGHWRISEMGAPNVVRRTLILYELPKTEQSLPRAFVDAVEKVTSMSNFRALDVLDNDDEIKKYVGHRVDFHPRAQRMCTLQRKEVYREQVQRLVDKRNERGQIQLGEISLLPRTMTNYFLNMYRSRVRTLKNQIQQMQQQQQEIPNQLADLASQAAELEAQIAAGGGQTSGLQSQLAVIRAQQNALQSRLDQIPGLISSAQSEIATLQPKISQLEAYQERLGEIEDRLREQAAAYLDAH
jgi:hypothetical protein